MAIVRSINSYSQNRTGIKPSAKKASPNFTGSYTEKITNGLHHAKIGRAHV